MFHRGCLVAALVLIAGQATGAEESWVLHGRVVDQQGRPVADVDVTTYWNANGVSHEEKLRFHKEGGDDFLSIFSANEGRMEAWGQHPTKTDADGNFSMTMQGRHYKLLAIDKERKRGALIVLTSRKPQSKIMVALVPLVRFHGRVRVAATGKDLESVTVVVRLPLNEMFPLGNDRLAVCSSQKSRFEFWLPPGDYELEAFGHIEPPHLLTPLKPITLAVGQREIDSGTHELVPEPLDRRDIIEDAKAKGTWFDIEKRYGKPAPKWHITGARGVEKDATVAAFRGKWVLLYFWGPW
jgi:hypothetical protein